ncbi:MAG TPA: cytochrome c oxidase subunit 3 family protein [Bryobacteraceae bacterium]|jgi:cytochrome c oxidase subunit 3
MSTTSVDIHGEGHGDGHAHDPHHQHHFTTMEQQFDTAKIGMWLFLVTEILLFGGLFVGFGMMQARYPREFLEAHEHLTRWQGALNTVVLLFSSFTMVMAVDSAKKNKKDKTVFYLAITIICACIFLVVKYFEYAHKFEEGWLPGRFYHGEHDAIAGSHGYATFFAFYFMMTGLHGFHIVAGIVALLWILFRAKKGEFTSSYYTPVDLVGLYWHIVDLIWIYLFPLYYLIQ